VHDRVGAKGVLVTATITAPSMRHVFADSGFAGRLVDWARDAAHHGRDRPQTG
jgi:hypothetical protein